MKRGEKVSVIKAVCKCIGVSDINARVRCSEASLNVLMVKAVRRRHDVSNVRALDAAWG